MARDSEPQEEREGRGVGFDCHGEWERGGPGNRNSFWENRTYHLTKLCYGSSIVALAGGALNL
jgi:hypothetical protein